MMGGKRLLFGVLLLGSVQDNRSVSKGERHMSSSLLLQHVLCPSYLDGLGDMGQVAV